MMTVAVHPDAGLLAHAVAARLITALVDAQAARGRAELVLTGGGIGIAALEAVSASPARDAVDWSRVSLWWGDERFLPAGDPERNETQARRALLDDLPLDAASVHPMPSSTGRWGTDLHAAADGHAADLGTADGAPSFDVVLLGVGPDGHVASLFPGHRALDASDALVVGVEDSPKPPPARISLTLPVLCGAREVWLLASGAGKAGAVARALAGDRSLPAARVHGTERTVWLVDRSALSG